MTTATPGGPLKYAFMGSSLLDLLATTTLLILTRNEPILHEANPVILHLFLLGGWWWLVGFKVGSTALVLKGADLLGPRWGTLLLVTGVAWWGLGGVLGVLCILLVLGML